MRLKIEFHQERFVLKKYFRNFAKSKDINERNCITKTNFK